MFGMLAYWDVSETTAIIDISTGKLLLKQDGVNHPFFSRTISMGISRILTEFQRLF